MSLADTSDDTAAPHNPSSQPNYSSIVGCFLTICNFRWVRFPRAVDCCRLARRTRPSPGAPSGHCARRHRGAWAGQSVATLRATLAAVRAAHVVAGVSFDSRHPNLLRDLRGAARAERRKQSQADPLRSPDTHLGSGSGILVFTATRINCPFTHARTGHDDMFVVTRHGNTTPPAFSNNGCG